MIQTAPPKADKGRTMKILPPNHHIYANVVSVSVGAYDVRLNFSDVANGESEEVETVVGVTIPPECASRLVRILTGQLASFQKEFGKIRDPFNEA